MSSLPATNWFLAEGRLPRLLVQAELGDDDGPVAGR